jgi:hypothetical protein
VRASRLGADHPVKEGHVIVAINGVSVVGPDTDINKILDDLVQGPRRVGPVQVTVPVRFRTEPTDDPPYTVGESYVQSSEIGSATAGSLASSTTGRSAPPMIYGTPGSTGRATVDDSSAAMQSSFNGFDDFDDDGESPMPPLSTSLQGATLNPLLELIHSWKETGPQAYDRLTRQDMLAHPHRTPRGTNRGGQATGERSSAGGRSGRASSTASAPSASSGHHQEQAIGSENQTTGSTEANSANVVNESSNSPKHGHGRSSTSFT